MMVNYVSIGKKIRQFRLKKHLSQEELSDMVYVSAAAISTFETGFKCMSLVTLIKLANALNVTADMILCDCLTNHIMISMQEFSSIFENCSLYESRIIIDNAKHLKEILQAEKHLKTTPIDSL